MKRKTASEIMLSLLLIGMLTLAFNIQQVKAEPRSSTSHDLHAVTCTDTNRAWAVGIMGTILHTTNGGATWEAQSSGTDWHLYDVTFINANEGWVVGEQGTILHTEDGGSSWNPQTSNTTHTLQSVCFIDNMTGWVVGDAAILHTTNGGNSWDDQLSGVPEEYRDERLNAVFFKNASVGWAGGDIWDEIVLCTNDGGISWTAEDLCPGHRMMMMRDIYFTDSDNGWILCGDRFLHTVDGGASWELDVLQYHVNEHMVGLTSLVFPERNTGWVAGTDGVILHTIDRAYSWVEQTTGTNVTLHDLCFADVNTGWAVGDQGTILSYAAARTYIFDVVVDDINYPVSILSNSTVSNFNFNKTEMQISFNVTGESGTTGYCNVTIPKSLLRDSPWTIKVDNTTIIDFDEETNDTHTFLYFTYTHESPLQVTIEGTWVIAEFPLAIILPLFMILSLATAVFVKLKKKKQ